MIVIDVAENKERHGRFRASFNGQILVESSRMPFLDAARALLGDGCPPETEIAMRHSGSETISLRSTVGKASKLAVYESGRQPPRFTRWQPYGGPTE